MQCYVEVEYIDDMGRFTTALLKRKGMSQVNVLDKVWADFFAIARVNVTNGGIMEPEHITVSNDGAYPDYCYGEVVGRDRIKGMIRTLARNEDTGTFSESEYRLNIHRGTGDGEVIITDWKYWG